MAGPNFGNMAARSEAAGRLLGGAPGAEAEPMPEPTPGPVSEGGEVEDALQALEGAVAALPPDKAEEVHTHINAIRELTAAAEEKDAAMPEAAPEDAALDSAAPMPKPEGGLI